MKLHQLLNEEGGGGDGGAGGGGDVGSTGSDYANVPYPLGGGTTYKTKKGQKKNKKPKVKLITFLRKSLGWNTVK